MRRLPVGRCGPVDGAPIRGTPLGVSWPIDGLELARCIGVAGIVCPGARVMIAVSRDSMIREHQALGFLAGAGAIVVGAKLPTTPLPGLDKGSQLLADLGMRPADSYSQNERDLVGG